MDASAERYSYSTKEGILYQFLRDGGEWSFLSDTTILWSENIGSIINNVKSGTTDFIRSSVKETPSYQLEYWPNPVKNILHVNGSEDGTSIQIFDTNGKVLKEINNTNQINLEELCHGFYLVKITDQNKYSQIFKILKE